MKTSKIEAMHNEFDTIPVYYCKSCLSLNVRRLSKDSDASYCDSCGKTDIGVSTIEEWLEMFKKKYGHYFLEEVNN